MLGIIGSDRKAFPPIWIKDTLDTTQDKYILSGKVLPMLNSMYGAGNFVWAQDGVPAHTSKATQKYLETKLGSGGFWSKKMWPPSSQNLNPLEYHVTFFFVLEKK